MTRPERILIADHDEDAIEILKILLTLDGHDVETSHSAAHAIGVAGEFLPGVVLLYAGMRDMDASEAAAHLAGIVPQATLVALVDWHRKDEPGDWQESGYHYCLVKPVQVADVTGLLQKISAKDLLSED